MFDLSPEERRLLALLLLQETLLPDVIREQIAAMEQDAAGPKGAPAPAPGPAEAAEAHPERRDGR